MLPQSPISLAEVIARVESNDDSRALRFEPGVFSNSLAARHEILERIMLANACNRNTARMIYATSWGRFQIMGFNLYAPPAGVTAWPHDVFGFVGSTVDQEQWFYELVNAWHINFSVDQLKNRSIAETFGAKWNGDGAAYGARILEILR